MTGKTHLAIGAAIGAAAAAYYTADLEQTAYYVGIAAFSALSADLDGQSMLSSKLGKISKFIREFALYGAFLFLAIVAYYYFAGKTLSPLVVGACGAAVLSGLVMKEGAIRNGLVSVVGAALIYAGYKYGMNWLMGFGLFVAWVPWLKHRGMTHTVWAIPIWGAIAWGLERQVALDGVTIVAMLGYLSHLVADTLTPSGVKWLYPLVKKSFKIRL